MFRQKVLKGEADVDGGTKDENANVDGRARDLKESHQSADAGGSVLRRFFQRIFVPLFLITFTPNTVVLLWYTAVHCDGSFLRLFQVLSADGLLTGVGRIWADIHIASPISVAVIVGYVIWALVLMTTLPGPTVEGPITPNGNVPRYRDNGFACYVVTMASFAVLAVPLPRWTGYSVTIVYDRFDEFLATLTIFAHFLCIFLYVKGLLWPSSTDSGSSGNPIFDYYWGTELYPRVAGVDIKVFTNCRFGMTVWPLLVAIFTIKNYELYGFVDSVWVSATLQMIYFTKFFWWESGYMRTIDIMLDRAGFYICWGCICWIPGVYASVSMYLASRAVQLGAFWSICVLAAGFASCMINYTADRQKLVVRQTDGKCLVWGRPAEVIRAEYTLASGRKSTGLLLVSGYWGIARHFHYVPELLLAFLWSVPALFQNAMPYTYAVYLPFLLIHRTFRDDTKCGEKYGRYWDQYCRRVPYKMLPYVF